MQKNEVGAAVYLQKRKKRKKTRLTSSLIEIEIEICDDHKLK